LIENNYITISMKEIEMGQLACGMSPNNVVGHGLMCPEDSKIVGVFSLLFPLPM
jgi:hypothetical protein